MSYPSLKARQIDYGLSDQISDIKTLYNYYKRRFERWDRLLSGAHPWILTEAHPSNTWEDYFIGPTQLLPSFLGVFYDNSWSSTGNPAPAQANFAYANMIGGGTILRCLSAAANNWIAIHTGDNYPVYRSLSPHMHMDVLTPAVSSFCLGGFVGSSNLAVSGAAWTTPDNGIWFEHDTNVDANIRFITRSGGTQTATVLGQPTGAFCTIDVQTSDPGDSVTVYLNGNLAALHTTNLPTVGLKPIMMVGSRDAIGYKDLWLAHYRTIFDKPLGL